MSGGRISFSNFTRGPSGGRGTLLILFLVNTWRVLSCRGRVPSCTCPLPGVMLTAAHQRSPYRWRALSRKHGGAMRIGWSASGNYTDIRYETGTDDAEQIAKITINRPEV